MIVPPILFPRKVFTMNNVIHLSDHNRITDLATLGCCGSTWYTNAIAEVDTLCRLEDWSVERFVSILSLTSPRVSVRRNVRIALQYTDNNTFLENVVGNIRQSVGRYEKSGTIGGQKVRAFRSAILGNQFALVLDVHMSRAFNVDQKHWDKTHVRNRAYRIVESVANRLGESIRDTQAMTWCGVFKRAGKIAPSFSILHEYRNWLAYDRNYPQTGTIATLVS